MQNGLKWLHRVWYSLSDDLYRSEGMHTTRAWNLRGPKKILKPAAVTCFWVFIRVFIPKSCQFFTVMLNFSKFKQYVYATCYIGSTCSIGPTCCFISDEELQRGDWKGTRRGSRVIPWPWLIPIPSVIKAPSPRKIFEIWTPEMLFPAFWASNSVITSRT